MTQICNNLEMFCITMFCVFIQLNLIKMFLFLCTFYIYGINIQVIMKHVAAFTPAAISTAGCKGLIKNYIISQVLSIFSANWLENKNG